MNFFNDKYLHSLDSKSRLLLPKDIRATFKVKKGDSLYLIPNLSSPTRKISPDKNQMIKRRIFFVTP
jgi:DNA-binding transcriptional regulator/RsmH inhibitor MraZ